MSEPHDQLVEAIRGVLAAIESPADSSETRLRDLAVGLDRLAYVGHFIAGNGNHHDRHGPRQDVEALRAAVKSRFSNLGCYALPMPVTRRIGGRVIDVADAVDDVTVIAIELKDVLWRAENVGLEDAAWQFRQGYHHHWGEVLRTLQVHLHRIESGLKPRRSIPESWQAFGELPAARTAWKQAR